MSRPTRIVQLHCKGTLGSFSGSERNLVESPADLFALEGYLNVRGTGQAILRRLR